MYKIILAITTIVVMSVAANAQIEDHAIGVRLGGGNYGGGFEASYQHGLGDANRLEFDLGLNSQNGGSYMSLAGVYQLVWSLDEVSDGFNWYAGPGAQLLLVSNATAVGVGGQVGVEYNLNGPADVPLAISLDTRPMFNFYSGGSKFGWGIALGIRYTL
tara:strand:+ start:4249 stop:4725 length:477 start_codon:yes stop_codon:yes gene_type:complete